MSRISTVIIRLTDDDFATKGGMHILAQMVSSYIRDQFDLDVAIRLEDERGEMISESVPLSEIGALLNPTVTARKGMIDIPQAYLPDGQRDDFAGLIGN
jgi:hypothetical protein